MQLDAEDEGQPFFKVPVAVATPTAIEPGSRQDSNERDAESAATATVEQEE